MITNLLNNSRKVRITFTNLRLRIYVYGIKACFDYKTLDADVIYLIELT